MIEKDTFDKICAAIVILLSITLLFFALFYHMIFKPEYRPGRKAMPLLWLPWVLSSIRISKKSSLITRMCSQQTMIGMCKVLEKQKVFSFNFFGKSYVFLFTSDAAERILGSSKWIQKSSFYDLLKPILMDGLFLSKGQQWKIRRKMLNPAFHLNILQGFAPAMNDVSHYILKSLKKIENEIVDIEKYTKLYAGQMLIKLTVGVDSNLNEEEFLDLIDSINNFYECFNYRQARPWLFYDKVFKLSSVSKLQNESAKKIHQFFKKMIDSKIKMYLSKNNTKGLNEDNENEPNEVSNKSETEIEIKDNTKYHSFLEILLDMYLKDKVFTYEDVFTETMGLFDAVVLVLATGMSYILYHIGRNKDIQKKIQDEIDEVCKHSNKDFTKEELNSLQYLECVIKEGFRLHPMVFISRHAPEDFELFGNTIEKGSVVIISPHVIHRDENVWPNPEKFDPTRFFPENSTSRPNYAFLAFSAGLRSCMGRRLSIMQLKTFIGGILRYYDVDAIDSFDHLNDFNRLVDMPDVPIRLKFKARENVTNIVE